MKNTSPDRIDPAAPHHQSTTFALVKRMALDYLLPYKGLLAVALLFMAISAATTAAVAQLMQPVLDDVLVGQKREMILPVALAALGIFTLRGVTTYIHTIQMNKIGQYIVADIQKDLFNRIIGLDLAFFHQHNSGEFLSRIISDVYVMRMAVSDCLTGIGKNLLTLIFLIIVMFVQDWFLALVAFTIFPPAVIFVAILGKRLRKISGNIQDQMAVLSGVLTQVFQGIRLVKAYGMEKAEKERVAQTIDRVKRLHIKSVRVGNLSTPVNEMLVGLVVFGVIYYGGFQVVEARLTPGELVAFIAAFILAYEPMKKLAKLNNILQMGVGAADRVFYILDKENNIKNSTNLIKIDYQQPVIRFKNLLFRYEGADEKALDGIEMECGAGTVTALVGPSGGGKSTFLNLIPRFYDPDDGAVMINGTNIRDLDIAELRRHIALVSQDITIFDSTARDNIRYGSPDADDGAVENAAKAASAHGFISSLPQGYDTPLGENGVKLSGGQKQRIAIARAILRDAPILLLDEATSALDNESERAVQEALMTLQKGKTTIVIAHRLSTIQNADNILVMQAGQIIEQGSHDDLVKKNGLYAQMLKAGFRDE